MHFLLIPYSLLCTLFTVLFFKREQVNSRTGMFVAAAITTGLLFFSMWLRPATGDSWRYLEYFRDLRDMTLASAMTYREPDPLYVLLNWLAGRVGDQAWVLFGATLVVYFGVFLAAIRRLVRPVEVLVVLMCYTAFPYFVAYGANGLRQGLALVFLLMAYVQIRQGLRAGWWWLFLAPLWHSGAWLAVAVTVAHQVMCRFVVSPRRRWALVLSTFLVSVLLSFTGLNESLMRQLPTFVDLKQTQEIYFTDAVDVGYRAGFRFDFMLFSLLPLLTALLLRVRHSTFSYTGPGWWLSLYLSLNVVYQLFAFAPFADRFAGFSWFLLPLVILLQVRAHPSKDLLTIFVAAVCLVNLAALQFYTGNFIQPPQLW